ncbi:MAG: hypothetical protein P8164_11455 [Gammaproteobacteria bacterium]|jgi:hypothetical protein
MHLVSRLAFAFSVLAALAGCPGKNGQSAQTNQPLGMIDNNMLSSIKRPCLDNYVSTLDIPADAALSPRADSEAEQLAFEATCTIAAPEDVYQRVSAELTGIRASYPMTRDIHATTNPYPLIIELDATATTAAFQAGTFHEWDTLNQGYGARIDNTITFTFTGTDIAWIYLSFKGNYDRELIRRQYALLPHTTAFFDIPGAPSAAVTQTAATSTVHQDDVCLSIDQQHGDYYYVFEEDLAVKGSFRADPDGNIYSLDPRELTAKPPMPAWYGNCLQWIRYPPFAF